MAQSDAHFGYQAQFGRDSHPIGRRFGLTCAPGMLVPVFKDLASPDDSYYIRHKLTYLRTLPLLAPAMIDVKVHFETFFVPLQMLYQPVENTLYSIKPIQSSNFDMSYLMNEKFPLFDYASYISALTGSLYLSPARCLAFRLADYLGLNPYNFCQDFVAQGIQHWKYSPSFFPWQILAYNTIFHYFYRLDDKSPFDNEVCNWDKYYATASVNMVGSGTPNFMTIHQRPWDFDYFTSIYRGSIVGNLNLQKILLSDTYSDLSGVNTLPINYNGQYSSLNIGIEAFSSQYTSGSGASVLQQDFSTAAIRQMFANEKLAMITGRTRKNYDSQVLAHLGVKVPHDVKHDLSLIAADTYDLNIGEVTSLASSAPSGTYAGSALGDLAGKGWSKSPDDVRTHKFTAPCHGVIMTIFSVEPKKRYFGGIDRNNMVVDCFDLPVPEFDRNGNVPMFRYETGSGLTSGSGALVSDIIGWKERYYQYKRGIDRTTVAFDYGSAMSGMVMNNNYASYFMAFQPFEDTIGGNGVRPDLEDRFYINPGCMNTLFAAPFYSYWKYVDWTQSGATGESWDATPNLLYVRDPFIADLHLDFNKVSWMSKDGEPVYPF